MIPYKLDSTDKKIINVLIQDAKMPLRKLALQSGVSFVTVMNRIKKLEKQGIIKRYITEICFLKLGFDIHVIIEMKIGKGKLIELEKRIARSPNVYAVYDTTGEYDATVLAKFRNTKSMDIFIMNFLTFVFFV